MSSIVRLYSNDKSAISHFLKNFLEQDIVLNNELEWEKKYENPIEIADIIGSFIDNNDKYPINMWISLDAGVFLNVTEQNSDEIIRYLYERFPW